MSAERAARNEAIFREVNEQIETLERQLGAGDVLELLCECSDDGCTQRLTIPRDDYERVRAVATRFLVRPGHVDATIEEVVDRGEDFLVVAKRPGPAADVAADTDPRS